MKQLPVCVRLATLKLPSNSDWRVNLAGRPLKKIKMLNRKGVLAFCALFVASLAAWWHPFVTTIGLALDRDTHTHILLIVPLSCVLIYIGRHGFYQPSEKATLGISLLAAALLIAGSAHWTTRLSADVTLSLNMLSLGLWWLGSFMVCFGERVFRSFLFPLCFLLFVVPIPEFALNRIVQSLQQESAFAARMMFHMARVPVTQEGTVLSIPDLDVEVAPECSSIRSSLILVILTLVLGQLLLRSWRRKAILFAIALPLSFVKNGFRIFVISELGTRVDPAYLDGWLHHHGGVVFLAVAIGIICLFLWALRRTEGSRPRNDARAI
jgi:exosortase